MPVERGDAARVVQTPVNGAAQPSPRRRGRPANADSEETRQRILGAAVEEFAVGGYAGVATRTIALRAGVTPATVYHHFPTKRLLYIKAYRHAINYAFACYAEAIGQQASVVDELRAILQCSLRIMRTRPAVTALAVRAYTELTDPELAPLASTRSAGTLIDGIVERAIARGELDPAKAVSVQRTIEVFLWGLSVLGRDNDVTRQECVDALDALLLGHLFLPVTQGLSA